MYEVLGCEDRTALCNCRGVVGNRRNAIAVPCRTGVGGVGELHLDGLVRVASVSHVLVVGVRSGESREAGSGFSQAAPSLGA